MCKQNARGILKNFLLKLSFRSKQNRSDKNDLFGNLHFDGLRTELGFVGFGGAEGEFEKKFKDKFLREFGELNFSSKI